MSFHPANGNAIGRNQKVKAWPDNNTQASHGGYVGPSPEEAMQLTTQFIGAIHLKIKNGNIQEIRENGTKHNHGNTIDFSNRVRVCGISINSSDDPGPIINLCTPFQDNIPVRFVYGIDRPIWVTRITIDPGMPEKTNTTDNVEIIVWY